MKMFPDGHTALHGPSDAAIVPSAVAAASGYPGHASTTASNLHISHSFRSADQLPDE
jgi:hypothetical protein